MLPCNKSVNSLSLTYKFLAFAGGIEAGGLNISNLLSWRQSVDISKDCGQRGGRKISTTGCD